VPGQLDLNEPDSAVLELQQPLVNGGLGYEKLDEVRGKDSRDRYWTLLDVYEGLSRAYPSVALTGIQFESPPGRKFDEVHVRLDGLTPWMEHDPFSSTREEGETVVRAEKPEPVETEVDSGMELSLHGHFGETRTGGPVPSVDLEADSMLTMKTPQRTSILEFLEVADDFRDFLTLGMGFPSYISSITASWEPMTGSGSSKLATVYRRNPQEKRDWEEYRKGQELFTLPSLQEGLGPRFEAWRSLKEELGPILDQYLGIRYSSKLYLSDAFLNIAQSLESFHRRIHDTRVDDPDEHEERLEEIYAGAPDEHVPWLKRKLSYSNYPSFKTRIRELFDDLHGGIGGWLTDDFDEFLKTFRDTRHYHTHFPEDREARAATGEDLRPLFLVGVLLFELSLLKEMGFEETELLDITMDTMQGRNIRSA
jgi:hypothetical protein